MRDKEFAPLISAGIKDIAETDLYKEFVSPFEYRAKDHRNNLLIGFGSFLNEFKTLEIAAEIWIDGSFATIAPDPADVDVVFYLHYDEVKKLKDDNLRKFEKLFKSRKLIRNLYGVEVHYAEINNNTEYAEWSEVFGTGYDDITPKGIFRLIYQ